TVIGSVSDQTFRDVLSEAIRKRTRLMAWIDHAGGIEAAIAELSSTLGLRPGETTQTIAAQFFSDALIAATEWPAVRNALAEGPKPDVVQGKRFGQLATLSGLERLKMYWSIFCTAKE